jgi:hypothetical protein
MVCRAGMADSVRRRVLAALLEAYLPALRSYVLAEHRVTPDRADDLLQGFIADKVLAKDLIQKADRSRGRFRVFLMAALDRFVIDQVRHERAGVRSPASGSVQSVENGDGSDVPAPTGPDAFDTMWARQVLELAIARTREECNAAGRADVWAVLEGRVLLPTLRESDPTPLDDLVRRLCVTPDRVSNLLVTGKRMFVRNLEAVVGEYAEESEVEDEIRWLRDTLGRARGS